MTASNGQFMSYLDSNQQDLLAAALSSNNPHQQSPPTSMSQQFGNGNGQNNFGQLSYDSTMDPSLFMNTNNLAMPAFDSNFNPMHDSPFLDYADNDANFDFVRLATAIQHPPHARDQCHQCKHKQFPLV